MLDRLVQGGDGHILQRDGMACGYAISRRFGRGHVIGPVVAESPTDARALIEAQQRGKGKILLQSEGAPIEFRNIEIKSLK